jgi:LysM repeat protein
VPEKSITTRHHAALQKTLPRQRREQASSIPHTPTAPPPGAPATGMASYAPVATEDDSAWLWLLIFLLLLTAIPLGYWLWPAPAREQLRPPSTTQKPAVAMTEQPAVAVPLRIERDGNGTINLIIDRKAATTHPTPPAQQDEPLTAAEIPAAMAGVTETTTTPTQQRIAEETAPPPVTQPEPCDCTHIVIKGDTLWDIAEQYTGDAFNYPELANRSRIKNPDRIYPGDRVRIIIR